MGRPESAGGLQSQSAGRPPPFFHAKPKRMSFLDQLADIGGAVLDTVSAGIGAQGTNITAQADVNTAQAQAIAANTAIKAEQARRAEERKDRQAEVFRVVIYSILGLSAIALIAYIAKKYR